MSKVIFSQLIVNWSKPPVFDEELIGVIIRVENIWKVSSPLAKFISIDYLDSAWVMLMNIFAIDFQEAYCLLIPRISLGKMLLKNYFSLQSSKMSFFFSPLRENYIGLYLSNSKVGEQIGNFIYFLKWMMDFKESSWSHMHN